MTTFGRARSDRRRSRCGRRRRTPRVETFPGSRRWAAHLVCAGLAAGALALTAACSVSQEEEREFGAEEAAQADSQLPLIRDTAITRFVTALGRSLASTTSRADLDWRFRVVNTAEVNAFALPGGFLYVNRGLIEQADRLDELAGVMAHEIGHVVLRHSVKQIQKEERRDLGLVLLCTLTRVCMTPGGAVAVQVTADAMTARYSRKDEAQADSEAVVITRRSGIDPEGLPAFFQKLLAQDTTAQRSPFDAFFATHPTDQARISAADRQIAELGPLPDGKLVRDSPEFHAIQARVRALPPPPPPTTQ